MFKNVPGPSKKLTDFEYHCGKYTTYGIIAALMIESSERQSVRQNTHDE